MSDIAQINKKKKVFYCPYCGRKSISPANIRQGITMCALCASFERQRFLYYVYEKMFFNTEKKIKLLHFAPEKSVYDKISKNKNIEYVCCDLEPENYPYVKQIQKQDGMHLSFADKTFDFIIHNHIMEHVPDDIEFLKECARVLKDDGKMIVSVPYFPDSLCDDTKTTGTGVVDATTGTGGTVAPTGAIEFSDNNHTADLTATLIQPGDIVKFTLTIKNDGTISADLAAPVIESTTGGNVSTNTVTQGNITFEVEGPSVSTVAPGSTATFNVTATFNGSATSVGATTTSGISITMQATQTGA